MSEEFKAKPKLPLGQQIAKVEQRAVVRPSLTKPKIQIAYGTFTPANRWVNPKVMFYGNGGSGKTTAAASFPGPVLFLDLDNGLRGLDMPVLRYPPDPLQTKVSYDEIDAFYEDAADKLANGKAEFKTLVIDGLNDLRLKITDNVLQAYSPDRMYDDQLTLGDYGKLKRDTFTTFFKFFELPCTVIFTAMAIIPKYAEDQIVPDLGSCTVEICRKLDAVGYCFTGKHEGNTTRRVSFTENPKFYAKDRLRIGQGDFENNYAVFRKVNKT